jgi:anhydro-N-acetylmuramic acid kinase
VTVTALLDAVRSKPSRLIVGLMSGTSADGVDAVLCEIRGYGRGCDVRTMRMSSLEYPGSVRRLLLGDLRYLTAEEVARLDFLIAGIFADAALKCIHEAGLESYQVDAVSSHGQTLAHFPRPDHPALPVRATLQVGDISVIAQKTGILTVGDFRPADMAQGGQGAPLVPYADFVLLAHPDLARVVQNIGGIANCTYLPPSCSIEEIVAFDTGPGNMVIDSLVSILTGGRSAMDKDGAMASAGKVDPRLLSRLLDNPYFHLPPPKSTGREDFGTQYVADLLETVRELGAREPCDLVATASELTVSTIVGAYRDFILPRGRVDQVIVGGGGSRNLYLMRKLAEELPGVQVMRHEDLGIPGKAKEALAFAILGNELIGGNPNNVPAATGAAKPVVMGKIALP